MSTVSDDPPLAWVLSTGAALMYQRMLRGEVGIGEEHADELIVSGFAYRDPDRGTLKAMAPELPIVKAVAGLAHQWLQLMPAFDAASTDLRRLAQQDSRNVEAVSKGRVVEELVTREQRAAAIRSALANARFEVCCLTTDVPGDPETTSSAEVVPAPVELIERGVRVRFIYEKSALDDVEFHEAALDEVAGGVEARVVDALPINIIVVDRRLIILNDLNEDRLGLVTTARAMVASYLDLFDSYWSRATPIGINSLNESTKPLSNMHQMVLSHVLTGKSADTIARILKVDSRTIRRRIDELCKYYDVDSRSALIAAALARDTLARDVRPV